MSSISIFQQPHLELVFNSTTCNNTSGRPKVVKMLLPRSPRSSFGRLRGISCSLTPVAGTDPEENKKDDGNFKGKLVKNFGVLVKDLWMELLKELMIDEVKIHVSKAFESSLFRHGRSFVVFGACFIVNLVTRMFIK